jgi:predicted Zn-dependent protease
MTSRRIVGRTFLLVVLVLLGCTTVPYTNRSRLMVMSESEDIALGLEAYKQILAEEKISKDAAANRMVRRVGEAIAAVAEKPEFQWEFAVIDDPKTVNAFALPGGKVAVYTGLFPVAKDEGGLATVMGHEVAHALARHGAERMSQNMAIQTVGLALAIGTSGQSAGVQQAVMQAYGLGAQVGVALPFSREMESEADHIGIILMAKAGYDPAVSVQLWERMAALERGDRPPEFLSTHPSSDTRIAQLREWIPEAMRYYELATPRPLEPLPRVASAGGS